MLNVNYFRPTCCFEGDQELADVYIASGVFVASPDGDGKPVFHTLPSAVAGTRYDEHQMKILDSER